MIAHKAPQSVMWAPGYRGAKSCESESGSGHGWRKDDSVDDWISGGGEIDSGGK